MRTQLVPNLISTEEKETRLSLTGFSFCLLHLHPLLLPMDKPNKSSHCTGGLGKGIRKGCRLSPHQPLAAAICQNITIKRDRTCNTQHTSQDRSLCRYASFPSKSLQETTTTILFSYTSDYSINHPSGR